MEQAMSLAIATFFAINIGASGTAAAMGAAYGGGAINRRKSTMLVAVCALAGAVLGGGEVIKTISSGIIPPAVVSLHIAVIILTSAAATLFLANWFGIPLSTSEVTVGALVGVGIAFKALYVNRLVLIVGSWVAVPLLAFTIAFLLGRFLYWPVSRWLCSLRSVEQVKRITGLALVGAGAYEAFAAGANNVANAVGPLVGAGLLEPRLGALIGGLGLGVGAITLGGRVLETNGKGITGLCHVSGFMVSMTSGTLVLAASLFGLPVPLTQATTTAIIGVGCASEGLKVWHSDTVRAIIRTWLLSPVASLLLSYILTMYYLNTGGI